MHTTTLSATSTIRLFYRRFKWAVGLSPFWTLTVSFLLALLSSSAQGQSLQINKSVDKTTANPGDFIIYTIQYNCSSITTPCDNVVITDQMPAGLFVSNAITNVGTATTLYGQYVTFNLGTLPAGTTGQVIIRTQPPTQMPGGTVLPNSATITSGGGSPIVSNTVSTTVNTVTALPHLAKSIYTSDPSDIGSGQLVQGQTGVYQLLIQNQGNTPYNNFCFVDTLPSPDKLQVKEIVTGDFAFQAGTVRVEYQTNTNTTWTGLSGSPFSVAISSVVPVSLPAGQYVTMVRWCFDQPFNGGAFSNTLPLIKFTIPADMPLGAITNCFSSSASNVGPSRACAGGTVVAPITGSVLGITKGMDNTLPAVGDTVMFTLQLLNNSGAAQALKNGVMVDSFNPLNLAYVSNSWSYSSTYSATAPTFSTATRTDGAILLKWLLTDDVPIGQSITITFKAIVKNGDGASFQQNRVDATGSNVQPNTCANGAAATPDYYDIDGDGNTTEIVCYNAANFTIQSLALLKSEKLVKGQLDATYSKYPDFGQTVPGGLADYRLKVYNAGSVPMKNAVIIDVLPFISDAGVLDPQARLSQWRPNLAGPVTPPTGVTVYYSTQSNPCRPELNYNPAGCANAAWTTVPPADITQVQALKFDFGSTIINPGDSLFLSWPMRAPTTAPTNGEIAWNSFGYIGTRTDNNTQLLPAEPIKVGIKANPLVPAVYGDFVWLDTDQDGIQDAGELGISGVKVELYKDNGDGIPNKTTDALVGFTVTDASGNYLFSSLAPGDYFAIFYPPSGYTVSPSLVGSDKTKDSEGIIAAVTSLSATEVDLTWDLGLYPSTTCDVQITNSTVSPCTYSGGISRATVNVFVTWANPPAGQNITVSVAGAPNQTINVTGGATSPTLLTFTIAADGATHAVAAGFNATCRDNASVLSPVPCAPAVCSLGLTNVLSGACVGTKRQVNATVSWSNNPVGENIIVTWDGVPVDTILVSGSLGSPQPASFYVTGGAGTHTIAAYFASTTACSASVSGISAPACVLPCGLNMVVTPGLCASATNAYVLSGTITATNVPTSGTLTISSGAFLPRTLALPAGNASGTFSYSGLVSNGQTYTVTASYSNSGCSPVSQTYTAPVSCTQPAGARLTLDKLVDKSRAKVGEVLTYTIVLTNVGSTTATNVVVRDSVSTGLRYVIGSAIAPTGTTFTPGMPIGTWTVGSISAGQSLSLTLQAIADSSGILYNRATIPGDTASVCTSVPAKVCRGSNYLFRLTTAPGRSSYKWFRDGVELTGQTTNVLEVTTKGAYTVESDSGTGQCPDFSCCPFIVEEDTIPPTFQAQALGVSCTGSTPQANGKIILSGFTAGNTYQYSLGNSFNAAASLSGAAQAIPADGVIVSNLVNPAAAQAYTIRVYNGAGCYADVTVQLLPTVCDCPTDVCVPFIIRKTKGAK